MIFILIYNRKKEGIKTLLIIPPTHLSHHREVVFIPKVTRILKT